MTFLPYETDILAKTIYGEARGEYYHQRAGLAGLIAVGNVVMNRMTAGGRFGQDIRSVCLKPFQFSCWNGGDCNRLLLDHAALENEPLYETCQQVATQVMAGTWPDLTRESNHYHAHHCTPKWARRRDFRIRIGRHLFYKLST